MRQATKDMELEVQIYKKRLEESESGLKNLKQQYESVRTERNICSKNMLAAKVSIVGNASRRVCHVPT